MCDAFLAALDNSETDAMKEVASLLAAQKDPRKVEVLTELKNLLESRIVGG